MNTGQRVLLYGTVLTMMLVVAYQDMDKTVKAEDPTQIEYVDAPVEVDVSLKLVKAAKMKFVKSYETVSKMVYELVGDAEDLSELAKQLKALWGKNIRFVILDPNDLEKVIDIIEFL